MTRYDRDCTMEPSETGQWVSADEAERLLRRAGRALNLAMAYTQSGNEPDDGDWDVMETVLLDIHEALKEDR